MIEIMLDAVLDVDNNINKRSVVSSARCQFQGVGIIKLINEGHKSLVRGPLACS